MAEVPALLDQVLNILQSGDSWQAIEVIESDGDADAVAALYSDLVMKLYWQARNLWAAVTIGRAGIHYCLAQAVRLPDGDAAAGLRSNAKAMAFNVASFTWPGWDEPGIAITPSDLATGLDCARLNLRLALELSKPTKAVARAHWIVGAHLLAAGNHDQAIQEFQRAVEVSDEDPQTPEMLIHRAYISLAQMAGSERTAQGRAEFDRTLEALARTEGEDARAFLEQLRTAASVFIP